MASATVAMISNGWIPGRFSLKRVLLMPEVKRASHVSAATHFWLRRPKPPAHSFIGMANGMSGLNGGTSSQLVRIHNGLTSNQNVSPALLVLFSLI